MRVLLGTEIRAMNSITEVINVLKPALNQPCRAVTYTYMPEQLNSLLMVNVLKCTWYLLRL